MKKRILVAVVVVLALAATASLVWANAPISSPDWYIDLDDAGYSDWMIQTFPDQVYHENLSGEWAAAIRYDGISTPGGVSMWLTPRFICPEFTTNSTFWTEIPLSTLDDPDNPTVSNDTGYSKISNGVVAIEISYTMHETEIGVAAGLRPGGAGSTPPVMSGRYALEVTYEVTNISGEPLTNIGFFQFLHGHPNDDYGPNNHGVYDATQYAVGAFPEYRCDIRQYGASLWNPPGSDIVGFSSADVPAAWGVGDFPSPGCAGGEPTTGLHLNVYNDTLPLTTSGGPAEIAGAMMWDYGTLLPGESFSKPVLLYNGYTSVQIPPPAMEVDIDIKPGSFPNSINSGSKGVIPVAILGSDTFDATTVDWMTVTFGPTGAGPIHDLADPVALADHQQDVNEDGYTDFVLHFRVSETGIALDDTEACLEGQTSGGVPIQGCDSVRVVK